MNKLKLEKLGCKTEKLVNFKLKHGSDVVVNSH